MIIEILIVLAIVAIIAIIINGIEDYQRRHKLQLPFEDGMNLLSLPIITLHNNNKDFNFLVDTGATYSVINSKTLKQLKHEKIKTEGNAYGVDGKLIPVKYAKIELTYKNNTLVDEFQIMQVDAFNNIKENHNIEIVGILGSTFLKKYNFIIDFKDLIIYTENDHL